MSEKRNWKEDVKQCEDARQLYELGLEMAEEISNLESRYAEVRSCYTQWMSEAQLRQEKIAAYERLYGVLPK